MVIYLFIINIKINVIFYVKRKVVVYFVFRWKLFFKENILLLEMKENIYEKLEVNIKKVRWYFLEG